jgi:hypothetical protein
MTPIPTTIEELNKLSRWTVHIMYLSGKFKDVKGELRKEIEKIVDSCNDSL